MRFSPRSIRFLKNREVEHVKKLRVKVPQPVILELGDHRPYITGP
jgi:hypothetical protein